jgi:hypothetical protein
MAVTMLAIVLIPAASASAASPAQMLVADVSSGPFHITVTAARAANAAPDTATGVFTAQTPLFTLHGPVTCLDIRGNSAGLFYPITSSDPPIFSELDSGVFIYFRAAKGRQPALVGFVPVPAHRVTSCRPGGALLPVTSGSLTLTR